MSITLVIGNAEPEFYTSEFPSLHASVIVKKICFNQKETNFMPFSSEDYDQFCKNTGIFKHLGYRHAPLIAEHPGCTGITTEIADDINRFVIGFEMDEKRKKQPFYEYNLSMLNTLCTLTSFAVSEFEFPAIYNY